MFDMMNLGQNKYDFTVFIQLYLEFTDFCLKTFLEPNICLKTYEWTIDVLLPCFRSCVECVATTLLFVSVHILCDLNIVHGRMLTNDAQHLLGAVMGHCGTHRVTVCGMTILMCKNFRCLLVMPTLELQSLTL